MSEATAEHPLKGHVVLVTGASGGIGQATCRLLARIGCHIGIHYNSDMYAASTLRGELSVDYGVRSCIVEADMGNYDQVIHQSHTLLYAWPTTQVRRMFTEVSDRLGNIDILVNNAGTTSGHSGVTSITDVPIEDFEQTWRVNCGSAYLLTQLCMPAMEKAGWGRVVFVSNVAGLTGGVVGPHYAYDYIQIPEKIGS